VRRPIQSTSNTPSTVPGTGRRRRSAIALTQNGGATPDHVAVQDLTTNQGFYVVVALTFVAGNLVDTVLLGLALLRRSGRTEEDGTRRDTPQARAVTSVR
jgi:hypothetical protein